MAIRSTSSSISGELASSPTAKPLIYIIDCDYEVCDAMCGLFAPLNVEIACFATAEAFMTAPIDTRASCMLIETNLPDMSGIELLERLRIEGYDIPTIMLATFSDVPTAVRAMQANAIDFIEKPFIESVLLSRVEQALMQQ